MLSWRPQDGTWSEQDQGLKKVSLGVLKTGRKGCGRPTRAGAGVFPELCPAYLIHAFVPFRGDAPSPHHIAWPSSSANPHPVPVTWASPATVPEGGTWAACGEVTAPVGNRMARSWGSQMGLSRREDSWALGSRAQGRNGLSQGHVCPRCREAGCRPGR